MNYRRYWQERVSRGSPFQRRRDATGRYYYQCPGHIGHVAQITRRANGRIRCVGMFDRWQARQRDVWPQKAYGLYWRTHPEFMELKARAL